MNSMIAAKMWPPIDDEDLWLEERPVDTLLNILPGSKMEEELSTSSYLLAKVLRTLFYCFLQILDWDKMRRSWIRIFSPSSEKALRIGQINDSLHGLRLAISRKAVVFRV